MAHRDLDFLRHINTLTYLLTYLLTARIIDNLCIYFRNHSLMSYSDDYVSVDLAITFVILDTLNIFLID